MENFVGKICPFCKTKITENDEVIICSTCNTPHHKKCWEENKGCTTLGCPEQHHEYEVPKQGEFCVSCGTFLSDGQVFCPKCGAPRQIEKKNICSKCGAELHEGQMFCSKCGQNVNQVADLQVNSATSKLKKFVTKFKSKKRSKKIYIAIVVAAVIVLFIFSGANKDFNARYSDIADKSWCEIAPDGSWMKIDTNPDDIENEKTYILLYRNVYEESSNMIKKVNSDLGFSDAVYKKMKETSALHGVKTESNGKYTVSWTYHPDRGLEVMYEKK